MAMQAGYEIGDDGNYYITRQGNKYLCIYNFWTNRFDEYLIESSNVDADIIVRKNEDGKIEAIKNTLDALFAEQSLKAKEENFRASTDIGIYEKDGKRYVYDIVNKRFVLESDATKPEVKTWVELLTEAFELAKKVGFKPLNNVFFIFEDSDGNKFKYDADEQDFIYYE